MSDTTLLHESNPTLADFVDRWRSKYQRSYDLTQTSEQANLYEGLVEMARHVAAGSNVASLNLAVSNTGVSQLNLTADAKGR